VKNRWEFRVCETETSDSSRLARLQLLRKSCQWVSPDMGEPVGFSLSFKNQDVPDIAAAMCLVCPPPILVNF